MSTWIAFQIAGDEGLPLVFLHGLVGDAESWRLQLDDFAGEYRAIAWDMPGYGDSAPLAEMSVPTLIDALSDLLDRLSLDRVHLIGHALGGMIAQAFALAHPERLRSLTLAATGAALGKPAGGELDPDWRERFVERQLGPLDRGASMAELAPRIVQGLVGDEPDPKGLEQAILSMAAVPEAGFRAAVHGLADVNQEEALSEIRLPALLIAGEKDPVAPPEVMEHMAEIMPDARLEIIEGSGHLLHLERPAAFSGLLRQFLKRLAVH